MGDHSEFGGGSVKGDQSHAGHGEWKQQRAVAGGGKGQHGTNQARESERPHATAAAPKGRGLSGEGAGGWGLFASDAEAKRRRRVAGYKAYAVEGKLKASVRQGIRWIKRKCSGLAHGW